MKGLTPIFLIGISIGAFFLHIDPQYKKIQEHRVEAVEYNEVLVKAQELKKVRAELTNKLAQLSLGDLDRLDKIIPEKIDTARLILDISGVADRYSINMQDITTSEMATQGDREADKARPYKASTISFNFKSSYEGMVRFVKDLEQGLRLVDVTEISLATGDGLSPFYNFSITLQAYWLNTDLIQDIKKQSI